jgi:penicillin-binding protein 2
MARKKELSAFDVRILVLAGTILLALVGIGVRLWFVQVDLQEHYRNRIQGASEVKVRIPAVRGEIRDRNGVVLVTNRPSYEVDLYLPDLVNGYKARYGTPPMLDYRHKDGSGMLHNDREPDIVQIVDQMIIPRLEAMNLAQPFNPERLRTHYRTQQLVPFAYEQDLKFATFSKFAEENVNLPGVQVNVRPLRRYLYGALAAHLLGYVGAPKDISKLPDVKDFNFYEPEVQGRTNIEYTMDEELRGKPGKRIFRKNAKNQLEGQPQIIPPVPGANVYLTIDSRIQYIVEQTLRAVGRAGCVVMDPNNGQILAMASVPSFDPNKFIPSISAGDWQKIKEGEANPLVNRAVSSYAPGSTFKIITALAGLTKGLAKARFTCTGGMTYGDTYMHCWGHHGQQTLVEAIKNSCDAYFYQFGNAAGIDAIDKVGKTFGLGRPTGVELTSEDPGLLPSPDWLQTNQTERWSHGQTANTSIGQGYVLTSPLQMALVASTVANGGTVYQPTLIYQTQQANGTTVRRPAKIVGDLKRDNGLTSDLIELVRKGMDEVVNADDGTGKNAAVDNIEVAGKTGTAQFMRSGIKDDHTWFVAFAPYKNPKIALAVMVEGGKSGGGVAAPIAAELIEKIMALDKGYDPGLKPLEPAIGNFKLVKSVSFKNGSALPQLASADETDEDVASSGHENSSRSGVRSDSAEPDIRPDTHETQRRPRVAQAQQPQHHSFFDFFRRKPQPQATPGQQQKKKHFLFF